MLGAGLVVWFLSHPISYSGIMEVIMASLEKKKKKKEILLLNFLAEKLPLSSSHHIIGFAFSDLGLLPKIHSISYFHWEVSQSVQQAFYKMEEGKAFILRLMKHISKKYSTTAIINLIFSASYRLQTSSTFQKLYMK